MISLRDKRAAFYLSFTLDFLETLKRDEKPKSHAYNRIESVQESVNRLLDVYSDSTIDFFDMEGKWIHNIAYAEKSAKSFSANISKPAETSIAL